ncbi:Sbal_3080 family lipoprotein [Aurantivibrio plasticivorans]
MRILKLIVVGVLVSSMVACAAPRYSGGQIADELITTKPEVVVIDDVATKEGFLKTIEAWLTENNYTYQVDPDGSTHDLQKLTIEYVGKWNWDMAVYLSEAKIEAFHQGQRVAEVEYKAPNSLNTNKFSNAEERVRYMLEVLFGKISADEATQAIKISSGE